MATTTCPPCLGTGTVTTEDHAIGVYGMKTCKRCKGTGRVNDEVDRVEKKLQTSDTEILDWLDNHSGKGWVCVNPFNRTGLRLNEMTKDVAGTDDKVYATIREAVISEMNKEENPLEADERSVPLTVTAQQESIPQIIMQLEVPSGMAKQTFRIVQTYRSDGSPHSMGLRIEFLCLDSMGKESWTPGENIPAWVEVLIDQYSLASLFVSQSERNQ